MKKIIATVLASLALVACGKDVPQDKDIQETIKETIVGCTNVSFIAANKTNGFKNEDNPNHYNVEYDYYLSVNNEEHLEKMREDWAAEKEIYDFAMKHAATTEKAHAAYVKTLITAVDMSNFEAHKLVQNRLMKEWQALAEVDRVNKKLLTMFTHYQFEETALHNWYSEGCSDRGKSFLRGIMAYPREAVLETKDKNKWFDKYAFAMHGKMPMRKTEQGWRLALN